MRVKSNDAENESFWSLIDQADVVLQPYVERAQQQCWPPAKIKALRTLRLSSAIMNQRSPLFASQLLFMLREWRVESPLEPLWINVTLATSKYLGQGTQRIANDAYCGCSRSTFYRNFAKYVEFGWFAQRAEEGGMNFDANQKRYAPDYFYPTEALARVAGLLQQVSPLRRQPRLDVNDAAMNHGAPPQKAIERIDMGATPTPVTDENATLQASSVASSPVCHQRRTLNNETLEANPNVLTSIYGAQYFQPETASASTTSPLARSTRYLTSAWEALPEQARRFTKSLAVPASLLLTVMEQTNADGLDFLLVLEHAENYLDPKRSIREKSKYFAKILANPGDLPRSVQRHREKRAQQQRLAQLRERMARFDGRIYRSEGGTLVVDGSGMRELLSTGEVRTIGQENWDAFLRRVEDGTYSEIDPGFEQRRRRQATEDERSRIEKEMNRRYQDVYRSAAVVYEIGIDHITAYTGGNKTIFETLQCARILSDIESGVLKPTDPSDVPGYHDRNISKAQALAMANGRKSRKRRSV